MEHIRLSCRDHRENKNIHKHLLYDRTIRAFQLSELDTLDCLRKQLCLALLTSAASPFHTTMKPRVASCNLTHWCWMVEREEREECDSRGNRINSVPFNSSRNTVTYRTRSIQCTSSFLLYMLILSLLLWFMIAALQTPLVPITGLVMQHLHLNDACTQCKKTQCGQHVCTHRQILCKNIYSSVPSLVLSLHPLKKNCSP